MRVLGRGGASLEGMPAAPSAAAPAPAPDPATAAPGPSVFMPAPVVEAPEEDVRVIDASRLTIMQAVQEEQDAAVMAGGVTAFSRDRPRVHGVGASYVLHQGQLSQWLPACLPAWQCCLAGLRMIGMQLALRQGLLLAAGPCFCRRGGRAQPNRRPCSRSKHAAPGRRLLPPAACRQA